PDPARAHRFLRGVRSRSTGAQRKPDLHNRGAWTYLDHLNPGGLVAITRWLGHPPRDTVKLFATAIAALETGVGTGSGRIDPGDRLVLRHGWNTTTLLLKNGRFTRDDITSLRSFAAERRFDLAWYPGMGGDEANRYNRLAKPTLYDAAVVLLGPGRSTFLDDYRFNIWPATDDRPFLFSLLQVESSASAGGVTRAGRVGVRRCRIPGRRFSAAAGRRGECHLDPAAARLVAACQKKAH